MVHADMLRPPLAEQLADDGEGLSEGRGRGRGLSNMKSRGQELGGALTVATGSGTVVRLELPLPVRYSRQAAD